MKIAFATVLSNGYMVFFDHLIKSILKHNPDFNNDFYVFYTDADCRVLSESNHKYLNKLYPGIKLKKVDFDLYDKKDKWAPKYYSIEAFGLRGYDKVVFLDADLLCRCPFKWFYKELEKVTRLAMVKEIHRNCYNAGVIVIDKSYLVDEVYNGLMNFNIQFWKKTDVFGHDQKIYNIHFKNQIQKLPRRFNTFVGEGISTKTVFSHYIHKPNSVPGRRQLSKEALKEWDSYGELKKTLEEIIT